MPVAVSSSDLTARTWRAEPDTVGRHLTFSDYKSPPHVQLISWLLMLNAYKLIPRLGISLPPGSGKALALETPVPTPTGWTTIGEIEPGDEVFDETGAPCRVVAVSPVWSDRPRYDVVTSDGDLIVADAEHEWPLSLCRKGPDGVYTTTVLAKTRAKRARSVVAAPLQLPAVDLPIDPYMLGVWLGDGSSRTAVISCHDDDQPFMRAELERRGYPTTNQKTPMTYGVLGLWRKLIDNDLLGNKHVPAVYLRASETQRRDLLRGLVDTDGHVNTGGEIEFTSTRKELAEAAQELVRSLGVKAGLSEDRARLNGRDCGPRYRLLFYMDGAALLPRKANLARDGVRTPNRYLQAHPKDHGPTKCIQVDSPSHLFLAGRSMTVTHNSEIVDHWNPVWLLDAEPRRRIVLASYAGLLAEEQGKRVRNTIETAADVLRVRIMQDTRAAASWKTSVGGGMWTVGIGGTLTGRRASNLFIDDPHKNFAEAMSEKNQGDTWDWYTSTARTRLLPRSPMGVIQTRWNENDLIGKLKAQDDHVTYDHRGKWLFVALPALADKTETIRSVIGPDWAQRLERQGIELFPWHREQGEALWPELEPGVPWFDEEEYNQIRAEVGEMIWAGLYQQRPAPLEGIMFKRDRWVTVDAVPSGSTTRVRRWDLAATADPSADATASCLMTYHHPSKTLYIEDMTRDRLESTDVEALVRQTALADRDRYGQVHVRIEREPGSSGKGQESNYLRNVLPEFGVEFLPSTGAKEVRAIPLAGQQGARHIHLCRRFDGEQYTMPGWWNWMIEEAAVFPHGANDDLVDAASLAYIDLLELIPRRSKARAQSSARKNLGF